jgi:hypothetical protein
MAKKKRKRRYSRSASKDVEGEMRRYKRGTAKSGRGGKGGRVKSRKQAIAIGLSKARKKGKKVPRKKALADRRPTMGMATYEIIPSEAGWSVAHEGKTSGSYATKEAAFEAATAAASNAIKQGHDVKVSVPGARGGEPTLGTS